MEHIEHARLAPSSAEQWVPCPGSVKAQEPFPDEETEDAKEGTASHWVASTVLEAFKGNGRPLIASQYVGMQAPNGVTITDEMTEGADVYINDILHIVQERGLLRALQIEQRVYAVRVHADNWGTPDAYAYDQNTGTLYIWDYKYGHRFVEVFENWQLIDYASGILDGLAIDGQDEQHIKIVFRIAQPRCYQADGLVREWRVTASDLRGYVNRLYNSAHEALSDNPRIQTGPYCRDCRARHACKGAQRAAMASLEYSGCLTGTLNVLPPEALGVELEILERGLQAIKSRYEALEVQALENIRRGAPVPGWGAKQGKGREKWTKPVEEIIALGDLMGYDLRKPGAKTPVEAKKLGIDNSVINAYSIIPDTGLKLVRDNDAKVNRIFSQPK